MSEKGESAALAEVPGKAPGSSHESGSEAGSGVVSTRTGEPRLQVSLWAHCEVDGVVSQQTLAELSPRHFLFRSTQPVKVGSRVRVAVGLPFFGESRVCSLSGRVRWATADADDSTTTRAAVMLDHETGDADRELLEGFLSLWTPDIEAHTERNPPENESSNG